MFTIAVTGGVATGKSTVVGELRGRLGPACDGFDCDQSVAELLTLASIQAKIRQDFGDSVFSPGGDLDRRSLRERVFRDPLERRKLESILHPEVLRRCRETQDAAETATPPRQWFVVDVPLLYEVGFPVARDMVICTGCAPRTQINRLKSRPSIDEDTALQIINAQLPQNEKFDRADAIVWTEGSKAGTRRQLELILALL